MKSSMVGVSVFLLCLSLVAAAQQPARGGVSGEQAARPVVNDNKVTKDQLEKWMVEHSNAGRWGKDDEKGTFNLITPEKRRQAAGLVKTGISVSLAHEIVGDATGKSGYKLDVTPRNPVSFERQDINFHGRTLTHLDGLCHGSYQGKMYNGFDFDQYVTAERGCERLGIHHLKDGIVTRGVLIDVPRLKGVPYLESATHVFREDIEAWEKKAGVKVSAGDVLLVRTGRWIAKPPASGPFVFPGLDASFLPFLKERDVAMLGSDVTQDVGAVAGFFSPQAPIHRYTIAALGMNLFDNLDLEAVAETAAKLKRWEFMFMASPLPVVKGTGNAINPIAVF